MFNLARSLDRNADRTPHEDAVIFRDTRCAVVPELYMSRVPAAPIPASTVPVSTVPPVAEHPERPAESLLAAYERMTLIRVFEERVSELYRDSEVPGFVHLSIGQEASAVGACWPLAVTDVITSNPGHGRRPRRRPTRRTWKSSGCPTGTPSRGPPRHWPRSEEKPYPFELIFELIAQGEVDHACSITADALSAAS